MSTSGVPIKVFLMTAVPEPLNSVTKPSISPIKVGLIVFVALPDKFALVVTPPTYKLPVIGFIAVTKAASSPLPP